MLNKYWTWIVIVSLSIIGAFSFISAQTTPKITEDFLEKENPSPLNELLSENIRTTIMSADSVQWMLIDSWVDNDSVIALFGQPIGEILCSKIVNNSMINRSISDTLTSPLSFQYDSLAKESTFMPDFGVMFLTPSDTVLVSYSLYCDICRFQRTDELIDLNGEMIRKEFVFALKEIFPKDKFVRNLTIKK